MAITWKRHALITVIATLTLFLNTLPGWASSDRKEIVFIDSAVQDAQILAAGVRPGLTVHFLDGDRDGLSQISDQLSTVRGVDTIHVVSHGAPGNVYLGDGTLSSANLALHAKALKRIHDALKETGSILFYGCNVGMGANGKAFIREIADATGANVSASVETVGNGNWRLDASTGTIASRIAFTPKAQTDYAQTLGPSDTISFNSDPFLGGYLRVPYTVNTPDFGGVVFKATDDNPNTSFDSLTIMGGTGGLVFAGTYSSGIFTKGLTIGDSGYTGEYGYWLVFGTGGEKFKFTSFKVGESQGLYDQMEVIGLRDGHQVASQTVSITPSTSPDALVTLPSSFDCVDEVRMRQTTAGYYNNGSLGFNGILINDLVLDTSPWTITSLVGLNPSASSPTNDSTVTYRATFGGAVSGVTASNFSLDTDLVGVSITSVSPVGGLPPTSQWDITVNTGTGDGNLTLELANDTGINPSILTTLPFSGDSYTIDRTSPTLSIGAPSVSSTTTGPVSYAVTYSDARFNSSTLAVSDITLNGTGTATGTIDVTGAGTTRTVTISNITGAGTLGISVAAGTATDTAGNSASVAGPSATFAVVAPPSISATFGAAAIPLDGTTSLTFTLANPTDNVIDLTGLAFTDNLPAGLTVATPNGLSSTCNGTATANAGDASVDVAGASLAPGSSCTVSLHVTANTLGTKDNSATISSTEGGTGNTSVTTLTVAEPPTILTTFGAPSMPLNGTTTLSFVILNQNATVGLTGIAFTDTLPAGLTVSSPNGLVGSCGGTVTATPGTNVVSLSGGTLAGGAPCSFWVSVTGTAAGTKNNSTGSVTSVEGGTGNSDSDSIDVVAPPSIAQSLGAATIPLNTNTSFTFTITNPAGNSVAESGVAFSDTLPSGIVVASPNGLSNSCGGTATAVAGSGSVSLSGASIAANGNCTLTVDVTGTASGTFTITTGSVRSTNGGTGNTASAVLTVVAPPVIGTSFGAASIPVNGSTSLTFTITNPASNPIPLTGIAFTDNLPAGLEVSTPSGLSNACGGTATAVDGSSTVSLTGASLALNSSCTLSVNVTGATTGTKNNSVSASATEGGTGNASNGSLSVVSPPSVASVSVPANGTYKTGDALDFTVNFTGNVAVDTGGGTPHLPLTLDQGGTVNAVYVSGSGTNALLFRYTIASGNSDSTGITVGSSVVANGGTLRDSAANDADLTLNSVGATANVLVDGVSPTVSSVGVPANGTYVVGQGLEFAVNFAEAVTVNTAGGTPYLSVTLDEGGTVHASYVSGSGSNALVFRYTIVSGNGDSTGVALNGSISANGATLKDAAGNDAVLALNGVPSTTGILVDGVAPTVSSISRMTPPDGVTNATSVTFTVTFSEPMTGITSSNFALTTSGVSGASVSSVTAGSGNTWTVVVSTGTGDGTIRLDLQNSSGATDGGGYAVSNVPYTSGDSYTIDKTAPTIAIGAPSVSTTTTGPVTFGVTYTGADTVSLTSDRINLIKTGSASGTVGITNGTSSTPTITVSNITGSGSLSVGIQAGTASDSAGNSAAASGPSTTVTVTNTSPVAQADAYSTKEDTPLSVDAPGVLANDTDANGDTLSAVLESGPSKGKLTLNADGSFTYTPNHGIHGEDLFAYHASDGVNTSNSATVTLTIESINNPPVANAGPDQSVRHSRKPVILDGSDSADPEGGVLTYSWAQLTGPMVTLDDADSARASFVIPPRTPDPASLTFRLTVTDSDGLSSSSDCIVNVSRGDLPPFSDAGPDQQVLSGAVVTLDGSNSRDPDGSVLLYQWIQIDGPVVTLSDPLAATTTFTAPEVGVGSASFVFELTVMDEGGLRGRDRVVVNVSAGPHPPAADAGPDQTVSAGEEVVLSGLGSLDPDGGVLSYEWTQLAGPFVALSNPLGSNPTLSLPSGMGKGAALLFQLTVSNAEGLRARDTCIVNVTKRANPPVIDAGADQTVPGGDTVVLHAFYDGLTPASDNKRLKCHWKQLDGPAVELSDPLAADLTFVAPGETASASILLEVTVTDQNGLLGRNRCIVNISSGNNAPESDAGENQTVTETDLVTLDAGRSSDPSGVIASYRWSQLQGPPVELSDPTSVKPTFVAPSPGTEPAALTFELIVTNAMGSRSRSLCTVTVLALNNPPTLADPPTGPSSSKLRTTPRFRVVASDAEGDSIQYRFDWGDGSMSQWNSTGSSRHSWNEAGSYCVKAQARDNKGAESAWSDCATITITGR